MSEFIKLENVSFSYDNNVGPLKQVVIREMNLSIDEGEFIALIGQNGCGKSTLAKMFNALILPNAGRITVDGMDTKDEDKLFKIRRRVGLVLQNPDNQIVASIVEEDVAFGPENLGIEPNEIRKRVNEALNAVGMYEHRSKAPYKLSGGQKQRVAIAGIIAMRPKCIIFDEPTSMLDPRGRSEVIDTITRLNRDHGISVILITHYMQEAVLADRVLVMNEGRLVMDDSPRAVFSDIDLIKGYNLDIPQATQLIYDLKAEGLQICSGVLDENECAKVLDKYFSKR